MIKPLRPNEMRFKNAMICIYVVLVLYVLTLISEILQYILVQDLVAGVFIDDSKLDSNDVRHLIITISSGVAYFISGIIFIMWFRRAYYNLSLNINTEYSEGWAAGGWFVPFISLYYPYKIMKELYVKTNKFLKEQVAGYSENPSIVMIGFWWAFWIISNALGQIIFRMSDAETPESFLNFTLFCMFDSVVSIVLTLMVIKVIKDYHELEKKYHEVAAHQRREPEPPQIIL